MSSKFFKHVSFLALTFAVVSLCSCNFWSRSAPQEASRYTQEYDPYTNSWRASRAVPTPTIHEPSADPASTETAEAPSGVIHTLKKPFRWVPGVN